MPFSTCVHKRTTKVDINFNSYFIKVKTGTHSCQWRKKNIFCHSLTKQNYHHPLFNLSYFEQVKVVSDPFFSFERKSIFYTIFCELAFRSNVDMWLRQLLYYIYLLIVCWDCSTMVVITAGYIQETWAPFVTCTRCYNYKILIFPDYYGFFEFIIGNWLSIKQKVIKYSPYTYSQFIYTMNKNNIENSL